MEDDEKEDVTAVAVVDDDDACNGDDDRDGTSYGVNFGQDGVGDGDVVDDDNRVDDGGDDSRPVLFRHCCDCSIMDDAVFLCLTRLCVEGGGGCTDGGKLTTKSKRVPRGSRCVCRSPKMTLALD